MTASNYGPEMDALRRPQSWSIESVDGLLPCPFCGAPGYAMLAGLGFKIKCTNTDCTVETPIKTHLHQVEDLWNRRAALPAPADQPPSQEAREYPPLPQAARTDFHWIGDPNPRPYFNADQMRSYVDSDRKARQAMGDALERGQSELIENSGRDSVRSAPDASRPPAISSYGALAAIDLLRRIEPHIDAIVCYASTCGEHEPNQLAKDVRKLLHSYQAVPVMQSGIEAAARWVESRRDAFIEQHGHTDPDTGALEFGTGPRAHAKEEYVGELEEIIEGIRALAASPLPAPQEPALKCIECDGPVEWRCPACKIRSPGYAAPAPVGEPREQGSSGWVSVAKRMPEPDDDVLVLCSHQEHHGGMEVATYRPWAVTECWSINGTFYPSRIVTHWMPLPQPPNADAAVQNVASARQPDAPDAERPISATQPASPARELTAEESAEDLAYLKERVAYWDEHLTAFLKEHGERALLSWVVSMLANQDAADRALREQGR